MPCQLAKPTARDSALRAAPPSADNHPVPSDVLHSSWPFLALLMYLLVTAVLTVLCYSRKHQVELHQRVRDSLMLRRRYAEAAEQLKARQTGDEA